MCAPNPYRPGRSYLLSPSTRDGKLLDGGCFTGRDVEHASETVAFVRRHFKNPSQYYIRGRVVATDRGNQDLVDYLLCEGTAKPLQGARVSTTVAGRYELEVPKQARYAVHVGLPPYRSIDVPFVASFRPAACLSKTLGLLSDSSISGKLWDRRGQLLPYGRVALIDLDDRPRDDGRSFWFRQQYPEEPDGSFAFRNVPFGRYLLAFNPDGPKADGFHPLALESTFYPNGVPRARAEVIEISSAGTHLTGKDLIAGPEVAFRPVTVKVKWADGSPMTTAGISVIGEPLEPGGVPWRGHAWIDKRNPEARLQVPADRKIRISVRDRYGRDWKQKYESVHEAGGGVIVREFVVVP
jgi:hypothetical protein